LHENIYIKEETYIPVVGIPVVDVSVNKE